MRVLMLCAMDKGGCLAQLALALRQRGTGARLVCASEPGGGLGWASDGSWALDGGDELRAELAAADVLHLLDLAPEGLEVAGVAIEPLLRAPGGPRLAMQWDGDMGGRGLQGWATACARWGARAVCSRPSAATDVRAALRASGGAAPKVVAPFVPWWQPAWQPLAPSTRTRGLGTRPLTIVAASATPFVDRPQLEALVDVVEDWTAAAGRARFGARPHVALIHGRSQADLLRRRRHAQLALCDHLGRGALEAMAAGVAVVMPADPGERAAWTELAGAPPPVVELGELDAALAAMRHDAEPHAASVAWARAAADPERMFDALQWAWHAADPASAAA